METRGLVELLEKENMIPAHKFRDEDVLKIEYRNEIVARLKELDRLKSGKNNEPQ